MVALLVLAACSSGGEEEEAQVAAQRSTSTTIQDTSTSLEEVTTMLAPAPAAAPVTSAPARSAPNRPSATTPATAPATSPPTAPPTAPATTRPADIVIQNFMFNPANKTVVHGQPVKVENRDGAPHSFTANSGSPWPECDLSGGQNCTVTAPGPGTYTYHCKYHATMTGTLTVT